MGALQEERPHLSIQPPEEMMEGWLDQLEQAARDLWADTSIQIEGDAGGVWIGQRPGPTWAFVAIALFVVLVAAFTLGRR